MTEHPIKPKDCPDGFSSLWFPYPAPDAAAPSAAAEKRGGVDALHGRAAARF